MLLFTYSPGLSGDIGVTCFIVRSCLALSSISLECSNVLAKIANCCAYIRFDVVNRYVCPVHLRTVQPSIGGVIPVSCSEVCHCGSSGEGDTRQ